MRNTLIETGLKNDDHKIIKDATESTVARKLREMKFALSLEQKYSKQQILEGYLNIAAFSPSTYGVEASARHYFSKSAKDLTVAEAALMAGTTNAPSAYDPVTQPELAKNRMDWVLTKMLEEKFITKAQYDQAVATPIASMLHVSESPAGCGAAGSAAYFCSYVVNEVLGSENFGPDVASRRQLLTRGGLKITTTLNLQRQSAADNVIQSNVPTGDASGTDTTIASIEPGTGRIQALAQNSNYGDGGPDSSDTQLVYAADAKHGGIELSDGTVGFQPGSTFKALILAEWFKEGNPAGAGLSAVPRTFQWNIPCAPENNDPTWAPKNVDPSLNRSTNVTEATKMSIKRRLRRDAQPDGRLRRHELRLLHRSDEGRRNPTGRAPLDRAGFSERSAPEHGQRLRDLRLRRQVLQAHRHRPDPGRQRYLHGRSQRRLHPGDGSGRRRSDGVHLDGHVTEGRNGPASRLRPTNRGQDRNHG